MTNDEAKIAIENVLKKEPLLGGFGFHSYCNSSHEKTYDDFLKKVEKDRSYLFENMDSFIFVVETLSRVDRIQSINKNIPSSYGLKHIFEKLPNAPGHYISNGVLIAGAIHCGFKYKKYEDRPNAYFNMSSLSIKTLRKENEGGQE
jgi:hypothetical protein